MTVALTKQFKANDSYLKLVSRLPLRPIRSKAQYDAAVKLVNELAIRGEGGLDAGEADYLDVLSDLVSDHDEQHHPIPPDARPAYQRLAALAKEHSLTHADLAKILGVSRPLVTLILTGQRELTKKHMMALGEYFKLEPAYFF